MDIGGKISILFLTILINFWNKMNRWNSELTEKWATNEKGKEAQESKAVREMVFITMNSIFEFLLIEGLE